MISTGYKFSQVQWEGILANILQPRSRWTMTAEDIHYLKAAYEAALVRVVRDFDVNEMSAQQLRDALERQVKGEATGDRRRMSKGRLLACFRKYAEKAPTEGTKAIYLRTAKKILEFDCDAERLVLDDIDKIWLERFDVWLRDTTSPNIRNMYFRNIRAVMNDAIREGLTTNYPFDKFKMPKLEETRKRNLTLAQMRELLSAPCEEWMEEYRDMFLLMVYLIGISPVDLLLAKKSDVVSGRLEYRRQKTHQLYSIKIEPEAMAIIKRYPGKKYLLSPLDRYASYKDYLSHMNRALKKIGTCCPKNGVKREGRAIFPDLSAYWARHTWGSIAAQLDVPLEIIARALGHSWVTNTVTSIYINFDTRKVDAANRRVLDALFSER